MGKLPLIHVYLFYDYPKQSRVIQLVIYISINLRSSLDGAVFVRVFVRVLPLLLSLWPAFTLTVHINALYNESLHRQDQHTSGINMIP